MKRTLILTMIFLLTLFVAVNAQTNLQSNPNAKIPDLKPTFIVSDIYVVMQILEGIELQGKEVEAFLDVKNNLKSYLETAQEKKLKVSDTLKVVMPGYLAQNIITFLARATLRGNMADQYKRFVDAIINSSKN
ncbi:hypothetical protein ACFLSQ_08075 [Bacteroidota bacterium]